MNHLILNNDFFSPLDAVMDKTKSHVEPVDAAKEKRSPIFTTSVME